ncbi:thioredoxin [Streptococcus agalactiae]
MIERFKLVCSTIVAVVMLFFTVVGIQTIWTENVSKDYDKHLTEQVYVATVVNRNANLIFYKKGCPYCEKGKTSVIDAAKKSVYPTFYIDVESESGQVLVKKYQVEKAATIVTLRDGKPQLYLYSAKDKQGKITADVKTIKEALDDSKNEAQ